MSENSDLRVAPDICCDVHVRWRPAGVNRHTVEYVDVDDWNRGSRWPLLAAWLLA